MAAPEADDFLALTFDCYGTLIDWRGGIVRAAAGLHSLASSDLARLALDREAIECELEAGPYVPYGELLAESLRRAARLQGREVSLLEASEFVRSMAEWPPFVDSRAALRRLGSRFRLAILSNVETRVLLSSVRKLDTFFEALITAEKLRSYKPARAHFDAATERLRLSKERILHAAVSLYHDIRPASRLGWTTAWVNREDGAAPSDVTPRWTTPDLTSLADCLGC